MRQKQYYYNLIFKTEPEGGYTVLVPALPGCITYGRTLDEAREMAIDAIGGYIKSLKKHNESIPNDEKSFITSLNFNLDGHYASPA